MQVRFFNSMISYHIISVSDIHLISVHLVDVGSCGSLVSFRDSPPPAHPAPQPHPLSHDDKRRHQILADIWTELKVGLINDAFAMP